MATLSIEIVSVVTDRNPVDDIVANTVSGLSRYISSRLYTLTYSGSRETALHVFKQVYFDEKTESIAFNDDLFFKDTAFVVDIFLRPGVLDLEQQYTKKYLAALDGENHARITAVKTGTRYYLFGTRPTKQDKDTFIKFGPVNPAIHLWKIIQ